VRHHFTILRSNGSKMNAADDDDLKLQRASATLLSDLERQLPKLLWKREHQNGLAAVHTGVRETDISRIFTLVW
jgi:tubulin-specific chaperone D